MIWQAVFIMNFLELFDYGLLCAPAIQNRCTLKKSYLSHLGLLTACLMVF